MTAKDKAHVVFMLMGFGYVIGMLIVALLIPGHWR